MVYKNMLHDLEKPIMKLLMNLISTQSLKTLSKWCNDYLEKNILPIYQKYNVSDIRPLKVLKASNDLLDDKITKQDFKNILKSSQVAVKEAKNNPAALAAIKAIMICTKTLITPTSSLSLALIGALAISYDRLGLKKSWQEYEEASLLEVKLMYDALKQISVDNEKKPSNIDWYC